MDSRILFCCLPYCKNQYKQQSNLIPFPGKHERQVEWIAALKVPKLSELSSSSLTMHRICSEHFEPKYFIRLRGKLSVTRNAVPTFNLEIEEKNRLSYRLSELPVVSESVMSATSKQQPVRHSQLQTPFSDQIMEAKCEVVSTDPNSGPQQKSSSSVQREEQDSNHSEKKKPNDFDFKFLRCDRNCETCQKYIGKLSEHVKTVHGDRGQGNADRDPLHIEIPFVPVQSSLNDGIKCEVEEVESMVCQSESEMWFHTGLENESESDLDNSTSGYQNLMNQELGKRPRCSTEDPLNTDEQTISTRDKSFTCEECGKHYTTKSYLMIHTRTHTLEGLFNCDECDRSFTRLNKLTEHRQIHTGDRPYECDECDKTFQLNSYLMIHKKIHIGERQYNCDQCEKTFNRSDNLSKHKKIHTEDRPFKCDECERSFTVNSKLTLHKRTHTGVRPYKCDECDLRFTRGDNLAKHKSIHTRHRPYKCDVCEKCFRRSDNLADHKITHNK